VTLTITDVAPTAQDKGYSLVPRSDVRDGIRSILDGAINPAGVPGANPGGGARRWLGQQLSAVLVAGPSHGSLSLADDGTFSYLPDAGYIGADQFTYQASDGILSSPTATVTLTVTDTAPTATAASFTVHHDTLLSVSGAMGCSPTSRKDSAAHRRRQGPRPSTPIASCSPSARLPGQRTATLTLYPTGVLPVRARCRLQRRRFVHLRASDGILTSAPATVIINVLDAAPTAHDLSFSVVQGRILATTGFTGVLAGALDADMDHLTAQLVAGPLHGTLSLYADGSFIYKPGERLHGTDTFTFPSRSTGSLAGATQTATITVQADPNLAAAMPPLRRDVAYQLLHDVTFTVPTWQGVLHNAQDPNGRVLSATLGTGPRMARSCSTPAAHSSMSRMCISSGTDSFTFQVSDDKAAGALPPRP